MWIKHAQKNPFVPVSLTFLPVSLLSPCRTFWLPPTRHSFCPTATCVKELKKRCWRYGQNKKNLLSFMIKLSTQRHPLFIETRLENSALQFNLLLVHWWENRGVAIGWMLLGRWWLVSEDISLLLKMKPRLWKIFIFNATRVSFHFNAATSFIGLAGCRNSTNK